MKKFTVVAGLAAALMLGTAANATDLEVTHWWTSGGEAAAVAEFAKAFDATGNHWVDGAIADGQTARAAIMQRILGGNPPGAAQFNPGREYEDLIKNNLLLDLTDLAKKEGWDKIINPKSHRRGVHLSTATAGGACRSTSTRATGPVDQPPASTRRPASTSPRPGTNTSPTCPS